MPFFCIHCKAEIDPAFRACPFCGEAITDFLRRYLETPIDGKYQILSRLGVGGMGEVYKALHVHLNSIRVIKLMRSNIAGDAGANERFVREARLATRINHPNVATLFDFATLADGALYMVWEYIEGINLHELINERGPLSPRYAAMLAVQALHGLDAIHRAGIVHRDVSPENLMISRDDEGHERVKIIDLGIAKSSTVDDNKTKTGMFVGKWKYCSPEHLGMLPPGERIDHRADLYSFGIVLYEMLTGIPPFRADTPHEYLMMHSSQQPRALREANPACPAAPELEALLFRALAKNRDQRFATAREFAQALDRIAPQLSDEAGAPPPLPQAAEATNAATRIAGADPAAPTVVSTEREAETMMSRPLSRVESGEHVVEGPARPRARRFGWMAVAATIAAIVAGVAWVRMNDAPAPVIAASVVPTQAPSRSVPLEVTPESASRPQPIAKGRVAINAFPWATVTSVRNLTSNQPVDIGGDVVTPVPLELSPGRYEITLANPAFADPIRRTVEVMPASEELLTVSFANPSSVTLPDFGDPR
jgi:serine/threonine protein kinase